MLGGLRLGLDMGEVMGGFGGFGGSFYDWVILLGRD